VGANQLDRRDGEGGGLDPSIEAAVFLQELHDALAHLRELPLRRSHPLGRHLGEPAPVGPAQLQRLLLDAIERLRPPAPVAADSPRWRRYRYLQLRYVEGERVERVVAALGISERQARREHQAALQELAALLFQPSVAPSGGPSPDDDQRRSGRLGPEAAAPPTAGRAAAEPRADGDGSAERWFWPGARGEPGAPLRAGAATDSTGLEDPGPWESNLGEWDAAAAPEGVDLDGALTDALSLVSRLAASRGTTIDYAANPGLPAVAATRTVLRQILLNLLVHFIEDRPSGRLQLSTLASPSGVEVRFVPVAAHAGAKTGRTDTPFGQAPDHPGESPSLAAAAALVEGQEGALRFRPTPAGPAIHLLLLTVQATLALVADDHPGLVHLFRRFVRGEGVRLVQARNGLLAQKLARTLSPDLLILDLMMPVQDGWDLFRALRADPATATIPIVACSILPERELALSLGAQAFLAKPVTPESLLAALAPFRRLPPPLPLAAG
jgi:CheY-like chemotaxis protein